MSEPLFPERVWQGIDSLSASLRQEVEQSTSGRRPDPPALCQDVFLPLSLWQGIWFKNGIPENRQSGKGDYLQACCMAGAWRPSQDVAIFDPDLYRGLLEAPMSENLPCEIFGRISSGPVSGEMRGAEPGEAQDDDFFALDEVDEGGRPLLISFSAQEGRGFFERSPFGAWMRRVAICMKEKLREEFTQAANNCRPRKTIFQIPHALECASPLLLCAHGLAEESSYEVAHDAYPSPKKAKKGWISFTPTKANIHELGKAFGKSIRKRRSLAHAPIERRLPRPHIRRAHCVDSGRGQKKHARKVRSDMAVAYSRSDGKNKSVEGRAIRLALGSELFNALLPLENCFWLLKIAMREDSSKFMQYWRVFAITIG